MNEEISDKIQVCTLHSYQSRFPSFLIQSRARPVLDSRQGKIFLFSTTSRPVLWPTRATPGISASIP
jgi:hypothetical protein